MGDEKSPRGDFRKRIKSGEHPFAAAVRPMEGGSVVIRPGFITSQFDGLRSFLSANIVPDFEQQLANLQLTSKKDVQCTIGEYRSVDVDTAPPYPGMTESGGLAVKLLQKNGTNNRVLFRPFRLEKYMSVDVTSDFGRDIWEGGTYVSLSTHGRGYPYREQMTIGASAEVFSGKGRMSIVCEYDVNAEGNAPASTIELRFSDDSEKGRLPDHKIAEYRRRGDRFVLDERGHWLAGVRKMNVQLPQEVVLDKSKGELVLGTPANMGEPNITKEIKISFAASLSPRDYIAAVKHGVVDKKILGGFKVS